MSRSLALSIALLGFLALGFGPGLLGGATPQPRTELVQAPKAGPAPSPKAPGDGKRRNPLEAEAQELQARLKEAVGLYLRGEREEATRRAKELFLFFEGTAFDAQLAAQDRELYLQLEREILALQAAMATGAPPPEVERRAREVDRDLRRGLARLRSPGSLGPEALGAFVQSLTILVREGLEALLIVGALGLVLRRTGPEGAVRFVYGGSALGVLASLGTAGLLRLVLGRLPAAPEVVEGLSLLLAVPVLVSVSYWLIALAQIRRWNAFLQRQVREAVGTGRRWALLTAAFLAVYREGAETVLFYQALAASAPGAVGAIVGGFGAGVGLLALLGLGMYRFGLRIPLRPFFLVTSAFLYGMAFRFAGMGIHELQEAGWISLTPLPLLNALGPRLQSWLTIYPYWEPVLAQLLLLGVLGIGLVLMIRPFRTEAGSTRPPDGAPCR